MADSENVFSSGGFFKIQSRQGKRPVGDYPSKPKKRRKRASCDVLGRLAIGKAMEEGQGNRQGQRTNKLQEIFPEVDKGQSRDLVAERVGMGSEKTYEAAKILKAKIEKN